MLSKAENRVTQNRETSELLIEVTRLSLSDDRSDGLDMLSDKRQFIACEGAVCVSLLASQLLPP